jgi:hypothetical protein
MKIIIGNLMFGGLAYGWYAAEGPKLLAAGLVLAGLSVFVGLAMGVWCSQPKKTAKKRKLQAARPAMVDAFDIVD